MTEQFFERPILNSPYAYPGRHWELDADGQPTNCIIEARRRSDLITPVPKPKKRRRGRGQAQMLFDDGAGLSSEEQEYNPTPIINEVRTHVEQWRNLADADQWLVTPETARLLKHWRHHEFEDIRPFFCQIEAVETARRSRFVVADFTQGASGARGGVYYEAGFAHGLNILVIFTCRADALKDVHFDTCQYNHIAWNDVGELRSLLGKRISATLGDGPGRKA